MITLDEATPADIPQLCELLGVLFSLELEFLPDLKKQKKALSLLVKNPDRGRIFVVRNGAQLLGMVSVQILVSTACGGNVLLLEDLVVRPGFHRQGHGSALLEQVIEFARRGGYHRITLLTDSLNSGAQRFYTRHGFKLSPMVPYRLIFDQVSAAKQQAD